MTDSSSGWEPDNRNTEDLEKGGGDGRDGRRAVAHPARRMLAWILGFGLLLLVLWTVADVVLLIFAAVLLALVLRGISDWVSGRIHVSGGWALAIVIISLFLILAGIGWLVAPQVGNQIDQLSISLPRTFRQYAQDLRKYEWGRWLVERIPSALSVGAGNYLSRFTGIFKSTFGAILDFFFVLIIGFYLAAEWELYRNGVVRLFPLDRRARASEILGEAGHTLKGWFLGQLFSMTFLGVFAFIGLSLLGIPLALLLALITAFLTFIPNLGPILSLVLPLTLALAQGAGKALWVFILYVLLQSIEGNLITPMAQRQIISLPPALLIPAQLLLAVAFGFWGLILAAPLTAFTMVLVRTLYFQDFLGEKK